MLLKKSTLWVLIGSLSMITTAYADDTLDALEKATALYKEGKPQEALARLEMASQLLRQQRGEKLATLLPEPLSGWEAEKAESASVGAAMFGGGLTVSRRYTKKDNNISITIVTDSPMLQGFMGMMLNPAFGGAMADGGKMQMINGQQAIVKPDNITMPVDNRFLVTIEGSKAVADDIMAYAKSMDLKKLSAFK
ncbi:hypothetical protein [Thiolinea disciformis]|uniref:hypothetical protein n=1 Tax=Thiolinea disciformis TaxID=125614 RepID=UPI00035F1EBF|nr:hypothetical protein [Thiolinea disciformis]